MFIPNVFYSSLIYDQSDNTVINIAAQMWWYIHLHWIDFQKWMTRWKYKCNENVTKYLFPDYFSITFNNVWEDPCLCIPTSTIKFFTIWWKRIYICSTCTLNLNGSKVFFTFYMQFCFEIFLYFCHLFYYMGCLICPSSAYFGYKYFMYYVFWIIQASLLNSRNQILHIIHNTFLLFLD